MPRCCRPRSGRRRAPTGGRAAPAAPPERANRGCEAAAGGLRRARRRRSPRRRPRRGSARAPPARSRASPSPIRSRSQPPVQPVARRREDDHREEAIRKNAGHRVAVPDRIAQRGVDLETARWVARRQSVISVATPTTPRRRQAARASSTAEPSSEAVPEAEPKGPRRAPAGSPRRDVGRGRPSRREEGRAARSPRATRQMRAGPRAGREGRDQQQNDQQPESTIAPGRRRDPEVGPLLPGEPDQAPAIRPSASSAAAHLAARS